MSLTPNEAATALRDIETTERRSASARSYKSTSPFLILWGLLWAVGYGTTELAPQFTNPVWLGVTIAGAIASTIIGMRVKDGGTAERKFDWRIFTVWIASLVFLSAIFTVVGPVSGAQMGAVIPLVIAWAYVALGAWAGPRIMIIGVALGALTLLGYFEWPQHFAGWMAVVGGGTLIGTGFWLRRV
jgi:hypothetical protein